MSSKHVPVAAYFADFAQLRRFFCFILYPGYPQLSRLQQKILLLKVASDV